MGWYDLVAYYDDGTRYRLVSRVTLPHARTLQAWVTGLYESTRYIVEPHNKTEKTEKENK